jgi:putative sterol carrier protein
VDYFLSPEWFEEVNARLAQAGPVPGDGPESHVVFELVGAPASGVHAMTFTMGEDLSLAAGDHLAAATLVRLSLADAKALVAGELESATALREGRLKVSGDLGRLVELAGFLQGVLPPTA